MIDQIKFNEQKATEAATTLLALTETQKADYLWIIKMLYFIDREALQRWERPITYDSYVAMPHGPVLSTIYNIIKKNYPSVVWKRYIVTRPKDHEVSLNGSPAPRRKLSEAEAELINEMYRRYGHLSGKELEDLSHHLPEWHDPKGSSTPITLPALLKVLDNKPEDIERISLELEQEQEINALFGA
ncbi:MAG: SocA family protein [Anaerolineales bacterium]|nr:SocA family protein [Anaerolineales bacterium]